MNISKELDNILKEAKDSGEYWKKGVPNAMMKMDNEINIIIEKYIQLSEEEKKHIKKEISTDIAWLLLYFSINMATYSLRFSEQKYFSNGLIALGIVFGLLDQREIILVMPLYYDVHKQKSLSFEIVLAQQNEFSTFVLNFLSRNEEDKTLECMGYVITKDCNNNPIYQRTW